MSNQTELQVIDPKEYGLEPVKASEMTSGLNSIIEERTALETIFNDVILKELNNDTLKEARELRLKIQKNRTQGINTWHTTNKAFYLAGGRFVDAIKNRECAINERLESKLDEIENHFKKMEEDRLNALKIERTALLEQYGEVNQYIDLKAMDDINFNSLLADTKLAYETRKENERLAELKRVEDEKKEEQERLDAEKKAEEERLKKVAEEKAEQERIKAENEKLRIENEAKEKELAKEREVQAEKDRLAKIESDRLAKIQAEKDAEIAKLKAEQEAEKQRKEKELSDEKARIEAEEAEKLAKEKALANAGDKEKIKEWFPKYVSLMESFPELKSAEGIELMNRAKEALLMVKKLIATDSKKLV